MDYEIGFDLARMDFRTLSDRIKASYRGGARTDGSSRRAFGHSLCGAVCPDGRQIAFGRGVMRLERAPA